LKSTGGYKKSARTVGEVIGQFHPHGDTAVYEALVGMAGVRPKGKKTGWLRKNTNEPLIEGRGNFGDHVDGAAAQRYTEAKISTYGENFLLDPDYLAVSDMVPNFSDDSFEPVILPAKIPNLLVNGSEGIAVGVASNIPSFNLDAIRKCAAMAIEGKLTDKLAVKMLKGQFSYAYGGFATDDSEMRGLVQEGVGAIILSPTYKEEGDAFVITSVCPRFNINKVREYILEVKNTASVKNETGDEGIRIVCRPTKSLTGSMRTAWVNKIKELCEVKINYRMSATIRHTDGTVSFKNTSIIDIFKSWSDWRIEIEKKVIQYKLKNLERELLRVQTLLIAIDNLQVIFDAVKKDGEVKFKGKLMDEGKETKR
jgi:DNA gyrase/topoisomerase IV subunit A